MYKEFAFKSSQHFKDKSTKFSQILHNKLGFATLKAPSCVQMSHYFSDLSYQIIKIMTQ